jgi:hypothetical protein
MPHEAGAENAEMRDDTTTNASPEVQVLLSSSKPAYELASILLSLQQTFTVIMPILDNETTDGIQ